MTVHTCPPDKAASTHPSPGQGGPPTGDGVRALWTCTAAEKLFCSGDSPGECWEWSGGSPGPAAPPPPWDDVPLTRVTSVVLKSP